ncbi:hypothetical protein N7470_001117 [Penicillium chermesinum]|nr:hypothetical protein N7470_001117 [Penicillium chermesinum]
MPIMTGTNGRTNGHTAIPSRLYPAASIQLEDFKRICSRTVDTSTYPLSASVEKNIPIYDLAALQANLTGTTISQLQDEWYHILSNGPGVFVLRDMYDATRYKATLLASNASFNRIIAHERENHTARGDHFASAGSNDRIWNSFGKHGLYDPSSFLDYYSNPWLAAVCSAWLGPAYRVTAQVNAVHPGGAAQESHRDFHLRLASQFLTLQGAVAHTDMPLESGPTRFLPFSQTYAPGYMAWRREDFRAFFQEHYVALPLKVGDGIFFNPALFHAAGANVMDAATGFRRVANLLQAAGGVADPDLDPESASVQAREVRAFVQAVAEGYPFPTNLDRRPPAPSGMAPESEQDVLLKGLQEHWTKEQVMATLRHMRDDSQA